DLLADLTHRKQVDQTEEARHPATHSAHAGQPDTGTPPEVIQGPQMRQIDRQQGGQCGYVEVNQHRMQWMPGDRGAAVNGVSVVGQDRKSTRLNSSHVKISYAV